MAWQSQLKGDPLPWLLEPESPGVRYLALRDILDTPADSPELHAARQAAHIEGPIAAILAEMNQTVIGPSVARVITRSTVRRFGP